MSMTEMCLIDEYIGTGHRSLDRALESERDSTIRRVVAQEDAQLGLPLLGKRSKRPSRKINIRAYRNFQAMVLRLVLR
jgi:hypothetical protein